MRHTKRIYKKSKRVLSKSKKLRNTKKIRFTKKRTHRGGYTWLENWNLKNYADDPEVQLALESYFNETNVVGRPDKALKILKANNNLYKSIKDLFLEMGVGKESNQESKYRLEEYESKTPEEREREREREKLRNKIADTELNNNLKRIEIETARKRKEDDEYIRRSEAIKRQEEMDEMAKTQARKKTTTSTSRTRTSGYSSSRRQ
jgi:hypothetical protein